MTIMIDSREKRHAITRIVEHLDREKIHHITTKLYVGDYQRHDNPMLVIDRKKDLPELVANLGTDKKRFMNEIRAAHDLGVKLIVLCEHGGTIRQLKDVADWRNPMLDKYPHAMTGRELMERMYRVHMAYGVEFLFCEKRETGKRIVEILSSSAEKLMKNNEHS